MKRAARGKTKYGVLSSPNIVPLPQGCKWNGPQKWSNLLSPLQMLFSQALQVALSYLLKPLQLQAVMGGNEDGGQRQKEREKNALYIWCLSRSHVLQREHAFSWGVTCWNQSAQQDTMTLRSFLSWNSMQKHLLKCSSKTRSRACLGSCAIFGSREAANGESRRKSER